MGPDNPWSPAWRPDESGDRLRAIRAARRGAILAVLVAAVTSLVSGGPFLRAGVNAAVGVVPLVVAGAALWVAVVRRLGPRPAPPPTSL